MTTARRSLPTVSDRDRMAAARLAADRLVFLIATWQTGGRASKAWDHYLDSAGGVTSELRRP